MNETDLSSIEVWSKFCLEQIDKLIRDNQILEAREIAIDWGMYIQEKLHLPYTNNWKVFKRYMVEKIFGKIENKRFSVGWEVNEVWEYLKSFEGRNCRIAIFTEDKSTGATNIKLEKLNYLTWYDTIKTISNNDYIEVFPESSTDNSICFRRLSTSFGNSVLYEIGKGQARLLFEENQNNDRFITYSLISKEFHPLCDISKSEYLQELNEHFFNLIHYHEYIYQSKCKLLLYYYNLDWLSIEGYFYPDKPKQLNIVDIEIPFDKPFNH